MVAAERVRQPRIVVGVHGSLVSKAAFQWAVRQTRLTRTIAQEPGEPVHIAGTEAGSTAARVLLYASQDADLLVAGNRGDQQNPSGRSGAAAG